MPIQGYEDAYEDYFLPLPLSERHPEPHLKRLYRKMQAMTGLEKRFLPLYEHFVDGAGLSDGIVMFDDVKHAIAKQASRALGKEWCDECMPLAEQAYEEAVKEFESKGLIAWHTAYSGTRYPQITGYNYYNDPEFYVAYRKKGDEGWNGRMSVDHLDRYQLCKTLASGEEIRERHMLQALMN